MNILHIDCSPRPESESRKLSAAILDRISAGRSGVTVVRRDLGRDPVPHADEGYATVLSAPGTLSAEQIKEATQLSEQLIREIEEADLLVIGTPMNNFTLPSVFKAWIDQVLRMGRTMDTTPDGRKVGLLQDKPVYIGIASGGVFTGENAQQPDFMIPYLRAAFACIGLETLQFFPLQATVFRSRQELEEERNALISTLRLPDSV
ncbi:MAG: NAD(P)H-dependent oxidoreductase [Desulfobulbus sp.]|nr:NAD(P)H-dependent oxidoreductase [Desulfobulbus sp.]